MKQKITSNLQIAIKNAVNSLTFSSVATVINVCDEGLCLISNYIIYLIPLDKIFYFRGILTTATNFLKINWLYCRLCFIYYTSV